MFASYGGAHFQNQTLDWTNTHTWGNGVKTSTVYDGNGTASGRDEAWSSGNGGNYRLNTFDGVISRNATTGVFSAESVASQSGYGYGGTVINHTMLVKYLGQAYFTKDPQGNIVNPSTGSVPLQVTQYVMQMHPGNVSDWDQFTYNRPVSVFSGTFVIDGQSVGAGFEELTLRDFDSGIDQFIPPVAPPDYTPPYDLTGAFLPQQNVLEAFGSGLLTGAKANVNGLSSAVVSTATIGIWDKVEPWPVTELDRAYGYDAAFAISNASGNILVGGASGGAGCWAKGAGTAGKVVGYGVKAMDIGGNIVGGGKSV